MDVKRIRGQADLQILNRDIIKYMAMIAMLLNHIAHIFLTRGTPLYEVLEDIGFFTAPVMCFFLVEGYEHTRSKMKYGFRLMLFAVVSQIPYELVFHNGLLNMIYTLLCCFLILAVMERVYYPFLKMIVVMLLMFATLVGDWPLITPILTVLLYNSRGNRRKAALGFGVVFLLFVILNVQNYMDGPGDWTAYAVLHAALAGSGIIAAAMAVLVLYNGQRAARGQNFSKWFFYFFYPAHLMALYLIKIVL